MENNKIKVLELFAGSRSVGKVAQELGMEVFSIDIKPFKGVDLVKDIEFLSADDVPFVPNIVWAGTPCTTYSIAGIKYHRRMQTPVSDFAKKCDRMNIHLLDLIEKWGCMYYIENPRGMLRKMDFMKDLPRATICYCKYGDHRMKPTDIWSNNIKSLFNHDGWEPRGMCFNNNKKCHHEPCPRGTNIGGTQAQTGNYERSKMPPELVFEILNNSIHKFKINEFTTITA